MNKYVIYSLAFLAAFAVGVYVGRTPVTNIEVNIPLQDPEIVELLH